mmetsp:Transcript_19706/g.54127  ORF Transcript_19706/g.54127 Transcript_19706/m.54127 type:complete len:546 (-) Transcript_19706:65-1702(-)
MRKSWKASPWQRGCLLLAGSALIPTGVVVRTLASRHWNHAFDTGGFLYQSWLGNGGVSKGANAGSIGSDVLLQKRVGAPQMERVERVTLEMAAKAGTAAPPLKRSGPFEPRTLELFARQGRPALDTPSFVSNAPKQPANMSLPRGANGGTLRAFTFYHNWFAMPKDEGTTDEKLRGYANDIRHARREHFRVSAYHLCPLAASLNRFGHELRVLGMSLIFEEARKRRANFSGYFYDGLACMSCPQRGTHNFPKLYWYEHAMNHTATRAFDASPMGAKAAVRATLDWKRDTVLFVDSMDSIVFRDPQVLHDTVDHSDPAQGSHSGMPRIVAAGERNCHPYDCDKPKSFCLGRKHKYTLENGRQVAGETLCDEMRRRNKGPFPHINGGVWWGVAGDFQGFHAGLWRALDSESNMNSLDQGLRQLAQLKYPELRIQVDADEKYAYIGAGRNIRLELGAEPARFSQSLQDGDAMTRWPDWPKLTGDGFGAKGGKPVLVHVNGDSQHPHYNDMRRVIRYIINTELGKPLTSTVSASYIDYDRGLRRVACEF